MLRRIAAGTSAAVVAAGLAAAPAVASAVPAPAGDSCADVAPAEGNRLDETAAPAFVFGPLADVPHLHSLDRTCFTAAAPAPDASTARRKNPAPPAVENPVPEVPTLPPPDDSGPGESGPPVSSAPPDAISPPPSPDFPPDTSPPPPSPGPTPTSGPAEFVGPERTVQPPPPRSPQGQPGLPQTARETRPLAIAGGGSLIAAGLAWIGGARRRKKRPAGPGGRSSSTGRS